jgi:alpha-acetolactate decarboxylase
LEEIVELTPGTPVRNTITGEVGIFTGNTYNNVDKGVLVEIKYDNRTPALALVNPNVLEYNGQ